MQLKKIETEKNLKIFSVKEEKNKEILEGIQKSVKDNGVENYKNKEILKRLEYENENLKDKLEAVECNMYGIIKEMTYVLENDENHIHDDDGADDFNFKSARKKKINLIR